MNTTTETQTYQNGLSKTCRYRDNSMNHVCYFGGKATYIKSCVGCHEDGRNAEVKPLEWKEEHRETD